MRGVFGTNVQNVAESYLPYLEVMRQLWFPMVFCDVERMPYVEIAFASQIVRLWLSTSA